MKKELKRLEEFKAELTNFSIKQEKERILIKEIFEKIKDARLKKEDLNLFTIDVEYYTEKHNDIESYLDNDFKLILDKIEIIMLKRININFLEDILINIKNIEFKK